MFVGRVREPAELCVGVRVGEGWTWCGEGRPWDKKFFSRVTECWPNGHESNMNKKFNATGSLWYKVVAIFSSDDKTIDWNFQFSVILQELRSEWWQPTLLVNEYLVCLDMWIAEKQM